ncbi:MAG: hypothetical protein HYT79_07685 [Elusimicrobia bacterium]|nr:hypothetical protein [Elusimicrobiota bacterium]
MDAKAIVSQVAHLARLGPYAPAAEEKLAKEFNRILELFGVLGELPKAAHAQDQGVDPTPLREDAIAAFGSRDAVIRNFPERESVLLKVPKVIE